MPFPDWRRQLESLPGLQSGYRLRSRSRTEWDAQRATAFLEDMLTEAGQAIRVTRRGFFHPSVPGQVLPTPRTLEELEAYLESFEEYQDALDEFEEVLQLEEAEEQPDDEDADPGLAIDFGDAAIDDEEEGVVLGEEDEEPETTGQQVCLRGFFVEEGQSGDDIYANYSDYSVTITDPTDLAVLTNNLPDQSRATRLERARLFYRYAFNRELNSFDDYDEEDASRAWLDAQVVNFGACEQEQTGAGARPRRPELRVPTMMNPLYRRLNFANPAQRRSYHSGAAGLAPLRVDHPGLRFDLRDTSVVAEYRDPWLRCASTTAPTNWCTSGNVPRASCTT